MGGSGFVGLRSSVGAVFVAERLQLAHMGGGVGGGSWYNFAREDGSKV